MGGGQATHSVGSRAGVPVLAGDLYPVWGTPGQRPSGGDELGNIQWCEEANPAGRGQLGTGTSDVEIQLDMARVTYYDEIATEKALWLNLDLWKRKGLQRSTKWLDTKER
ncbi:hypothetical protein LIER_26500 [Lithospermum erythrorhizon]|uniref:Uncharacterized protein n=1 Tax=Lithospermum erythrorhizon TaxID=34254 RepID=A0AAV3R8K3_LITER